MSIWSKLAKLRKDVDDLNQSMIKVGDYQECIQCRGLFSKYARMHTVTSSLDYRIKELKYCKNCAPPYDGVNYQGRYFKDKVVEVDINGKEVK